jgi:uncharacterized protein with PQ loop repeat
VHLRKRLAHGAREPYPATTRSLRLLDRLMIGVALCSPLMLLPQVLRVFQTQAVDGLSIYTWSGFAVLNLLWTLYGFTHRDKPIMIASSCLMLLDIAIVAGILMYGG